MMCRTWQNLLYIDFLIKDTAIAIQPDLPQDNQLHESGRGQR